MDAEPREHGDKMKFIVMVKQVPDTTLVSIDDNGNLIRAGVPSILDPYCEYAFDLIRRIKKDDDHVIAVTMGPPQAKEALLRCLEIGADEAYLLTDPAFAGADTYATSRALMNFVTKTVPDFDLVLCGKQAADGDTSQVPAEVSSMLCLQQFYYVENISRNGNDVDVEQNYGDELRICKLPDRALISVSKGDTNRYLPSIEEFLIASNKDIKTLDRISLGLGNFSVGLKGSKTRIVSSYSPKSEHRCFMIDGTDASMAAKRIKEVVK
jgi:electron transfer flavoprotein beta subunit